ncbi:outer membrane beta-barrel protein [Flammeovirga aprica]|uniref:Outer membrane beta-barrel protein n=1 Tax=Flammeovirga aprica JL-4 TaxID=694437 RepID=A0A7X9RST1_9BACT|nr:outer membrane beta-barrel protein [Flammeovirga aprica]NME67620.1 outer membrane beta-barrel protein [Flammeovirga aprica JL-4]
MKHILTALLLLMSVQSIYAQNEKKGDPDPRDMDFNHNEAKGQWYTSLTVQLSSSNAENEDQFIRELHKQDNGDFEIGVQGGYFIKDFFMVGLEFSYSSENKNEIYTANNVRTHLKSIGHGYFFAPFIRNYIPLSSSRRFSIFNQTSLQVGTSRRLKQTESGTDLNKTMTDKVLLGIGIQPGLAAFIADGFAFEASVGLLGLEMEHVKGVKNYTEESQRTDFDLNFRVNLLQIKLAVAYYF